MPRRHSSFAAAFLLLLLSSLLPGCGKAPLHPWHDRPLAGEFSVDQAARADTFQDYLALEELLFRELADTIRKNGARGPENQLLRYAADRPAPPADTPDYNRSFELPVARPRGAILLLHGMSDSPYSLRAIGTTLNRHGYRVVGLRLPGHGTIPAALKETTWPDMTATVAMAADYLATSGQPYSIIGFSTGATLALEYTLNCLEEGKNPPPASLVLVSPAVAIHPTAAFAGMVDSIARLPGLARLAWLSLNPEVDPYKYSSFAVNAASHVYRLTRSVAGRIKTLAAGRGNIKLQNFPKILVFSSAVDDTVDATGITRQLLNRLPTSGNELVLFDRNRFAGLSPFLHESPELLAGTLPADQPLPFALSLISNRSKESMAVSLLHRPAGSLATLEPIDLGLSWPAGVFSLSHLAITIPPDDPFYGPGSHGGDAPFPGTMLLQGENSLLAIPFHWLFRLRYNPFYPYFEARTLDWVSRVSRVSPDKPY